MEIMVGIVWGVRTGFPSQLVVARGLEAENYTMEIVVGIVL